MVYESYPWKRDLQRRKYIITCYNSKERFDEKFDETYTALEKAVFYSAFIIRKLIDCHGKLSDDADDYEIETEKRKPIKEINGLNRWLDFENYDWDHFNREKVKGKDICNWLIHSYIFRFDFNTDGYVKGFFVSSDYDRNKYLYYFRIEAWLNYMSFISSDYIVELESKYDEKKHDYIYTRKVRGK